MLQGIRQRQRRKESTSSAVEYNRYKKNYGTPTTNKSFMCKSRELLNSSGTGHKGKSFSNTLLGYQKKPMSTPKSSHSVTKNQNKRVQPCSVTPYYSNQITRKNSLTEDSIPIKKSSANSPICLSSYIFNANSIFPISFLPPSNLLMQNKNAAQPKILSIAKQSKITANIRFTHLPKAENKPCNPSIFHKSSSVDAAIDTSSTSTVTIRKYSYYSKQGYLPDNPNKVNQDNFIAFPKLGGSTTRHLFAVADGHGNYFIRPIRKRNIITY
jgi:hypothetical protein